jgi:hypothetical protein
MCSGEYEYEYPCPNEYEYPYQDEYEYPDAHGIDQSMGEFHECRC